MENSKFNFLSLTVAKRKLKAIRQKRLKAFTLIELLIVIAIVGILSAMIFVSMNSAQASARDGRRQSELSQTKKALQAYYLQNGRYPTTSVDGISLESDSDTNGTFSQTMKAGGYMSIIPRDPKYAASAGEYAYKYIATSTNAFILCAKTEVSVGYACIDQTSGGGIAFSPEPPVDFGGWGGGGGGGWQIPTGGISGQWGVFMGNKTHTGLSSVAPSSAGTLKWSNTSVSGPGWSVIASNGTIYTGGSNYLYAVNPANGSVNWSYRKMYDSLSSHPVVASDGNIILVSFSSDIVVLDPSDGSVAATSTLPDRREDEVVSASPNLGSDGTLYIGSYLKPYGVDANSPALRALNPDLSLKWQRTFPSGPLSANPSYLPASFSPSIGSDGTVYFNALGKVYALNPNNGSNVWVYDTGASEICTTPAVASDGTVYATAYDNCLYAVNPGGTQKWRNCNGSFNYGSPSVGPTGRIYTVKGNELGAYNPSDGSLAWSYNIGGSYASTPSVASNGTIYYHSFATSKLYAINPDGTLKWEQAAGRGPLSSSPSIADNGTVYAAGDWGGLYAFE